MIDEETREGSVLLQGTYHKNTIMNIIGIDNILKGRGEKGRGTRKRRKK